MCFIEETDVQEIERRVESTQKELEKAEEEEEAKDDNKSDVWPGDNDKPKNLKNLRLINGDLFWIIDVSHIGSCLSMPNQLLHAFLTITDTD